MSKQLKNATKLTAMVAVSLIGIGSVAAAGDKPVAYRTAIFDIDKRKKAKTEITDWASYSAYASARYSGERNLSLDDGVNDRSDRLSAYAGIVVRAEPTQGVIGFVHAEGELTHRATHKSTATSEDLHFKEAVVAFRVSENTTLSLGRMRFADQQKWAADAAVDGLHFGHKGEGFGLDFAAFAGTGDNDGLYALAHAARFASTNAFGALGVLETQSDETKFHLTGYWAGHPTGNVSYSLNAGFVVGDGLHGKAAGLAFDARAITQLGQHEWNPQLVVGLAGGSEGFAQTGLHSN